MMNTNSKSGKQTSNTRVSKTSIEAYYDHNTQKKIPIIEDRIIVYLQTVKSDTSRGISKHLGIERNSITQPLKNLHIKKGLIHIHKTDKCPTTGYKVSFYGLVD